MKVKSPSPVRLLVTLWTAAYQAPPSMGFSRQQYWSGVPLPSLEKSSNILKINLQQTYLKNRGFRKLFSVLHNESAQC